MWPIIIVGLCAGIALVYEIRKHIASTLQQEGWTPVPAGPSTPTGTTQTASGAGVMLTPGNMGAVTVAGTNGFPPPTVQVQVQPPTATGPGGIGYISGITSSDQSVVSTASALINPGQPGQMSTSLTAMAVGTTTITVQWNDGTS